MMTNSLSNLLSPGNSIIQYIRSSQKSLLLLIQQTNTNSFPSTTKKLQFKFTSYSLYNVVHTTMTKPFCTHFRCNTCISKTSASVSSGVPNTEKVMKARGRRPSAFIVSRCLEPLMKHEARVFDMASQMKQ